MRKVLEQVDRAWTKVEVALCVAVAGALLGALTLWVALKGLSSRTTDTYFAGLAFRALAGALLLGPGGWRLARRAPAPVRSALAAAAVAVGVALGWALRGAGVDYFGNLMGWLQDGSSLTLVGGLRGLGTRLTLWLSLLGASLATAGGRHVSIDVATRALGERLRGPFALAGGLLAALVCAVSAWGFLDYTAVDTFHAAPGARAGEKLAAVASGLGRSAFIARRQLALDVRMLPKVVGGAAWASSFTAAEWNDWLDASDWAAHFTPEQAASLRETGEPTAVRAPLVAVPGAPARGLLVHALNLVIPFGLLMMALRFLLWVLRGGPQEEPHAGGAP